MVGAVVSEQSPHPLAECTFTRRAPCFGGYLKYDHHHYCEAQVEDYDAEDDAEGDGRAVFLREAPNSLTNNSKKGDIFPFGAMSPFYCFFSRGPSLR